MADNTKIEWTEATWNPITGCSVVSPGCTNCYAMRLAGTRLAQHPSRAGLTRDSKAGPVWTGEVRLNPQWLDQPLRWKRPRMIFVCAHGDLFHESVPDEWIDKVFAIMALAPQHTFQVLTKRSRRMRKYLADPDLPYRIVCEVEGIDGKALADPARFTIESCDDDRGCVGIPARWPLPNIWLGVSAEDQARADERIPDLLATPAAVRWLSAEPLLGPVDLTWIAEPDDEKDGVIDALLGCNWIDGMGRGTAYHPTRPGHSGRVMTRHFCSSDEEILATRKIDWVVAGGESGQGARPMHPDWARSLRDQCAAAGVPFFFKQWGAWSVGASRDTQPGWIAGDLIKTKTVFGDDAWVAAETAAVSPLMERLGKRHTGRLLDGVEHNGMPGALR
jgi:protein gp37